MGRRKLKFLVVGTWRKSSLRPYGSFGQIKKGYPWETREMRKGQEFIGPAQTVGKWFKSRLG